jgi:hypothetical protein
MARILSGLAYGRHVASVVLAGVIGFATGLAAIGFRELARFFNLILLERAWTWAEATLPCGRAALPVVTGAGGLVVGLLFRKDVYAAYTSKTVGAWPESR